MREGNVQFVNLTDDELWRAIADNTSLLSKLLYEHLVLEEETSGSNGEIPKSEPGYLGMVLRCDREYRAYTAELRRRYLGSEENVEHVRYRVV
jgi:hypothetical protein